MKKIIARKKVQWNPDRIADHDNSNSNNNNINNRTFCSPGLISRVLKPHLLLVVFILLQSVYSKIGS